MMSIKLSFRYQRQILQLDSYFDSEEVNWSIEEDDSNDRKSLHIKNI